MVEPVWNRFQSQYAFSEDETPGVDSENTVHISRNIELLKSFDTCFWPILDILLGLLEFFRELDTRVREDDSLEDHKLSLSKFDVDDRPGITNNDDLGVLISLLDGYSSFGNCFVASVDTLREPDDTVLLGEVQGHLQSVDGAPILVHLYDLGVLEVLEHLIVNVLG